MNNPFSKKRIAILGSTGSVGKKTLEVARYLKDEIEVGALACHSQIDLLEEQMRTWSVNTAAVYDVQQAHLLQKRLPKARILAGMEGLEEIVTEEETHLVVLALSGFIGILPALKALSSKKTLAIANKEPLVSAGEILMKEARLHKVSIVPMDSEHSAIFQCLKGEKKEQVRRLILTASGGPFWKSDWSHLEKIEVEQALRHPNYSMGARISIDSSTLMNKGLEVLEARALFEIPLNQIEVVVHPQQIIHSFVEFIDGHLLAQASMPDMAFPIQYALTYPNRRSSSLPALDFTRLGPLTFDSVDHQKFPCLELAYIAGREGGSFPCFLNAANETLVQRFLSKEISWLDIPKKLEKLLQRHSGKKEPSLNELLVIDAQTREEARCF